MSYSGDETTVLVFGYCGSNVREKDWRCRKRGAQTIEARQGDLAGVTHVRQYQSFERMHALCFRELSGRISSFSPLHFHFPL